MILVDTNIWLRIEEVDSESSQICIEAVSRLRAHGESIAVCAQVITEYWAVASRPVTSNGLGMAPDSIARNIHETLTYCTMIPEPHDVAKRWLSLAERYAPIGRRCHDLRLVAVAEAGGISRILTLNKSDFRALAEITAIGPDEV